LCLFGVEVAQLKHRGSDARKLLRGKQMSRVKSVQVTPQDEETASLVGHYADETGANRLERLESIEQDEDLTVPETTDDRIPYESKIIVGVEHSGATGWHSLHLHDSLYAISVRPGQGEVVIAEGFGRGRLRHMRIAFKNIFRFEAVEVPIGHNCLALPINADLLGDRQLIQKDKPFVPVMVRLLIKHSTRTDFVSIHDVGATPLPILAPFLRKLPKDRFVNATVALNNANDCFTLARNVVEWVRNVNTSIRDREISISGGGRASVSTSPEPLSDYQELQRICSGLDFNKPDVRQTLVGAYAAVYVSIHLYSAIKGKKRMVRVASNRSAFPLNDLNHTVTIDELYKIAKRYHEKTRRPIKEAFDAFSAHINDLDKRNVTLKSSKDLSFLEKNAPRAINIIDPTKKINEKTRVLNALELRHEKQLRSVFKNEGIPVYYLPRLRFLSLLVEYQTDDGQSNFAVIIRKGLHQALKEFLLAHEMGHWFRHIHSEAAARSEKVDRFLRSSGTRSFLEDEADDFGMAVLFPPAYLADREILKGKLSTKLLLDEFLQGMKEKAPLRLRREIRRYISVHIERYKEFKKAKAPSSILTIEVESIKAEEVEGLLALIEKYKKYTGNEAFYWVRLDENSDIIKVSDNSVKLFGRSKKELLESTPLDLVVPEERERMRQRARFRMEHKKAIYYFTEILNKRKKSSQQVIVYSFPILDNKGKYVGAMAALRPLDEIETGALLS
jgi:PAS domain S-box-containing protein